MTELSQEEEKQKNYYNAIAHDYDEHYSSDHALKYRHMIYDEYFKKLNYLNSKY